MSYYIIGGAAINKARHQKSNNAAEAIIQDHLESAGHAVENYVAFILKSHELNAGYSPYTRDTYIPNLFLKVLRSSGATTIFDMLDLPNSLHCPYALENFTKRFISDTPSPPFHRITVAFADDGLFKLIRDTRDHMIAVEHYYVTILKLWMKHGLVQKIIAAHQSK